MSPGKFSPVTSMLLVRKGEAAPSRVRKRARRAKENKRDSHGEQKFVFSPDEASPPVEKDASGEKPRRIVLHLTPHEYETIGLVAVKEGVTRHDLAQSAMTAYVEWLVSEYGESLCRTECEDK